VELSAEIAKMKTAQEEREAQYSESMKMLQDRVEVLEKQKTTLQRVE
jgi:hypothetical protein